MLSDIASINPTSQEIPDVFYYIDLESVVKGNLIKETVINKATAPSRAQRVAVPNDIFFQTVRPYQQNNYLFEKERNLPTVASTGYAQIRTCEVPYFLYELLHTKKFLDQVLIRCTGSSYPAINGNDLCKIAINIPSHNEQQVIANFLRLLEKKINLQSKLIDSLMSYKRGLFLSLSNTNNNDWEKYKLSDFITVYGGYAFDSKTYTLNGKYSILTIGNVTGDRYADISEAKHVSKIPTDLQSYQKLNIGDLVVSMTGNVGRVSIVNHENCLLNQRVAKLVFNDPQYKEIILQVLSCGDFAFVMEQKGQGAAQKNIRNSDIENYEFSLPSSIGQIETLSSVFKLLDAIIEKEGKKLSLIMQTKWALLQQLFI